MTDRGPDTLVDDVERQWAQIRSCIFRLGEWEATAWPAGASSEDATMRFREFLHRKAGLLLELQQALATGPLARMSWFRLRQRLPEPGRVAGDRWLADIVRVASAFQAVQDDHLRWAEAHAANLGREALEVGRLRAQWEQLPTAQATGRRIDFRG